jgi:hypothetical protein
MLQRTVEEQARNIYWQRQRQLRRTPRVLLRESDEVMYWLEECLVQNLRIVPGWLMPRLVTLLQLANPEFARELGRERRPAEVLEVLFRAQEVLMEKSTRARRPGRIVQLFK